MTFPLPAVLVAAAVVVGVAPADASAAEAATVQPHQAEYRLSAQRLKLPGAEGATDGLFVIRLQQRCEDWALLTRMSIGLDMAGGRQVEFLSLSSLEESLDGRRLTFQSETLVNDQVIDTVRGAARVDPEEGGVADIFEPEPQEVPLPPGAMFPIAAFKHAIDRIARGERFVDYVLFDGSGPQPLRGSDVVLGPAQPLDAPPEGDAALLDGQGWRVVSAFYEIDATDAPPLVSNVVDAYRNGVASRLMLDLGVMEVEGTLTSLRALPEPEC